MIAMTVRAAIENLGDLVDADPMTFGCEECHAPPGETCALWCIGYARHLDAAEDQMVGTVTTAGALLGTERGKVHAPEHEGKALRFYGLVTGEPVDVVVSAVREATAHERYQHEGTVTIGYYLLRYGTACDVSALDCFGVVTLPAAAQVVLGDTLHRED